MWLLVKNTRGKEILKLLSPRDGQSRWRQQVGLPPDDDGNDGNDDDDDGGGGGGGGGDERAMMAAMREAAASSSAAVPPRGTAMAPPTPNGAAVRAARERGLGSGPNGGSPPPSGAATLMFTDLEGSTKLWEALPDDFKQLLDLHSQIVRAALKKHNGYEVGTYTIRCNNTSNGCQSLLLPVFVFVDIVNKSSFAVCPTAGVCVGEDRGRRVYGGLCGVARRGVLRGGAAGGPARRALAPLARRQTAGGSAQAQLLLRRQTCGAARRDGARRGVAEPRGVERGGGGSSGGR
jgi:hypothetical protein